MAGLQMSTLGGHQSYVYGVSWEAKTITEVLVALGSREETQVGDMTYL